MSAIAIRSLVTNGVRRDTVLAMFSGEMFAQEGIEFSRQRRRISKPKVAREASYLGMLMPRLFYP